MIALGEADRRTRRNPPKMRRHPLRAYLCPLCQAWHLTKQPQRNKRPTP